MPAKYAKPVNTTQTATVYKAALDSVGEVCFRTAGAFAPSQTDTPSMAVRVEAGPLFIGTTLTELAVQTTGAITAPTTNPRIDRVVKNKTTGLISVVTGTEAASPVAPAITSGCEPICQVALSVGQTVITNANITDERLGGGAGVTVDTDSTFAANSDLVVPSQKAVKTAIAGVYGKFPSWTTATRPVPVAGTFAFGFNTTKDCPEWYDAAGAAWVNFADPVAYTASYLMVAGGGGGAGGSNTISGGGGAGGLLSGTLSLVVGTSYPIVIGAGGAGSNTSNATAGGNTTFNGLTAIGGGYGSNTTTPGSGGSGGGGGNNASSAYGSGTSGQGNNGNVGAYQAGGGGGGAGAVGTAASSNNGGAGAVGLASSITGTSVYYAAGGGGGGVTTAGAGGNGGGGHGGLYSSNSGVTSGTANTGGGGGGGAGGTGGNGGSGVFIIAYAAPAQRAAGGTVTSYTSGGTTYWVHIFTSSGTFTA